MAFNYFPIGYQPFYPNQFQQNQQMFQNQQQGQIQNGGYYPVRSEEEARNWFVPLGNIVTFIDETKPYCYKKAMGMSPLDRPVFEKYRIVKEDTSQPPQVAENSAEQEPTTVLQSDGQNAEIGQIRSEIKALKEKIAEMEKWHDESKLYADVSANEGEPDAVLPRDGHHAGNGE